MVNIQRLIQSFSFAIEGVIYVYTHDQNLRIHTAVAVIVMIASIIFRVSSFEKGILGVVILLVICAEMINSAIEQMVDLISIDHRKQAKIAKDVAAGMVLLTVIGSVIVGVLVFIPYIVKFFG
ncbi:MAG: diacylglycerol kinase family protein [Candidatus Levybacteria bacterium]|nr:diacylglycerol kinase family protein [Candidatus Levybacteria bacterium]